MGITKCSLDHYVFQGRNWPVVVAGFVLFKNHQIFQNKEQKGEFLSLIKNICHLFLYQNQIFIMFCITFNLGMKFILIKFLLHFTSSLCQIFWVDNLRATHFWKCNRKNVVLKWQLALILKTICKWWKTNKSYIRRFFTKNVPSLG